MADVCWSGLRGRPQFVVESVGVVVVGCYRPYFGGLVLADMAVAM